jgi:DHA1 family multidrug resistance protein-like MFS transporter
MKLSTLKLCLPVIAITVQNNAASLIIPPLLQQLRFPVATIGALISLGPVLALLSRIPAGMSYRRSRARLLISLAVLVMAACNALYSLVDGAFTFALVHGLNGFAYGAVTTLYLAFYVDSLAPDENRNHAMGYYVGGLAAGYSIGNFGAGYWADRYGYDATFYATALLALAAAALLWLIRGAPGPAEPERKSSPGAATLATSLRAVLEPDLASVLIVALFLNLLHQIGNVFLPLYGLAIGLSLTQVGVIRACYSLCNAITRPISGLVVSRIGHRRLSYTGLPLQSGLMMLVPVFTEFGTLLSLYVAAGFMRAVALVSNAVSLVQDVDESKAQRGVASGLYNAAGDLGNILGPTIGGLVASAVGIAGLFVAAPLGATAVFLGAIAILQRRARPERR